MTITKKRHDDRPARRRSRYKRLAVLGLLTLGSNLGCSSEMLRIPAGADGSIRGPAPIPFTAAAPGKPVGLGPVALRTAADYGSSVEDLFLASYRDTASYGPQLAKASSRRPSHGEAPPSGGLFAASPASQIPLPFQRPGEEDEPLAQFTQPPAHARQGYHDPEENPFRQTRIPLPRVPVGSHASTPQGRTSTPLSEGPMDLVEACGLTKIAPPRRRDLTYFPDLEAASKTTGIGLPVPPAGLFKSTSEPKSRSAKPVTAAGTPIPPPVPVVAQVPPEARAEVAAPPATPIEQPLAPPKPAEEPLAPPKPAEEPLAPPKPVEEPLAPPNPEEPLAPPKPEEPLAPPKPAEEPAPPPGLAELPEPAVAVPEAPAQTTAPAETTPLPPPDLVETPAQKPEPAELPATAEVPDAPKEPAEEPTPPPTLEATPDPTPAPPEVPDHLPPLTEIPIEPALPARGTKEDQPDTAFEDTSIPPPTPPKPDPKPETGDLNLACEETKIPPPGQGGSQSHGHSGGKGPEQEPLPPLQIDPSIFETPVELPPPLPLAAPTPTVASTSECPACVILRNQKEADLWADGKANPTVLCPSCEQNQARAGTKIPLPAKPGDVNEDPDAALKNAPGELPELPPAQVDPDSQN